MYFSTYRKEIETLTRSISFRLELVIKKFTEKSGITPMQYQILYRIGLNKVVTIGALSANVHMDAGNTSAMCKKLEKLGFVERHRSQTDERIVQVSLTKKGNGLIQKINTTIDERYSYLLEQESPEELELLKKAFQKMDQISKQVLETMTKEDDET